MNQFKIGDIVCIRPKYLLQDKKRLSESSMSIEYIEDGDEYIGVMWFNDKNKVRRGIFHYEWLEHFKYKERRRKIGLI
jgi:hypothetical protein